MNHIRNVKPISSYEKVHITVFKFTIYFITTRLLEAYIIVLTSDDKTRHSHTWFRARFRTQERVDRNRGAHALYRRCGQTTPVGLSLQEYATTDHSIWQIPQSREEQRDNSREPATRHGAGVCGLRGRQNGTWRNTCTLGWVIFAIYFLINAPRAFFVVSTPSYQKSDI